MSDWNALQIAAARVLAMASELRGFADQCTSGGARDVLMDIVHELEAAEGAICEQLNEESSASD